MSKKDTKVEAPAEPKEPASCNLRFPKASRVKLMGFNHVSINEKVRVVVTGTVKEISDSANEWDPGKRMTINVTKCNVAGPQKETTIDDALKASVDTVA